MQPRDRPAIESLRAALDGVITRERGKFLRRLRELDRTRDASAEQLDALAQEIAASCAKREARAAALPQPTFPEALPVSARRDEIAAAIAGHQVVIVCGETGSGKTTQLPKICLALGRGVAGLIGHTQPRRIAARTVANRIAHELATPLGERGRLQDPLSGPGERRDVRQGDDRRHPARGNPDRPHALQRTTRSSSTKPTSAVSTSTSCSATRGNCCRGGPISSSSSPPPPSTPSASRSISAARRWSRSRGGSIRSRCAIGRSRRTR